MAVTVRYPIDFTCAFTTGCGHNDSYPVAGRHPVSMHTHLDAPAMDAIGGGTSGLLCSLRTVDGDTPGSIFIQANVPAGTTDGTDTSSEVIDDNATTVSINLFALGDPATPVHYTGYADVTYSDGVPTDGSPPAPFPPGTDPGPPAHVNNCTTSGDYLDSYRYGVGFKGPVEALHSEYFYNDGNYNIAANAFGSRQVSRYAGTALNQTGDSTRILAQGFIAQMTTMEFVNWDANFSTGPNQPGSVVCELRPDAGGYPSASVIASSTISTSTIISAFGNFGSCSFTFSPPVTLTPGTMYWLSLRVVASTTWTQGIIAEGLYFIASTTDQSIDRSGTPPGTFAPHFLYGPDIGSMIHRQVAATSVPPGWDRSVVPQMIIGGEGLIVLGGLWSYCSPINGQGNAGVGDDTRTTSLSEPYILPLTGWGIGNGGFGPPEFGLYERTPGNWHHFDGEPRWGVRSTGAQEYGGTGGFDPVVSGTPMNIPFVSGKGYLEQAAYRSDGTHVVFGNSTTETVNGVAYRRASWQINDHGNWGIPQPLIPGSPGHYDVIDVLVDANDYAHLFFKDSAHDVGGIFHAAIAPDNTIGEIALFDCVSGIQPGGTGHDDPNAIGGGVVFPYVNSANSFLATYWPSDITTFIPRYEELPKPEARLVDGIQSAGGRPSTDFCGPGCITFYGTRGYLFTNTDFLGGVFYAATFDPATGWTGSVRVHPPENPAGNTYLDYDFALNAMDGISANYIPSKGLIGLFYGWGSIYTSFGELWFQYYSEPELGYPDWAPAPLGATHAPAGCYGRDWWSWGYNNFAEVGRAGYLDIALVDPQLTSFLYSDVIQQLACSQSAGIARNQYGSIYVWGDGYPGSAIGTAHSKFGDQFPGVSPSYAKVNPPTKLNYDAAGTASKVGINETASFWLAGGHVYGVGQNYAGEFGTGEAIPTYHGAPIILSGLPTTGIDTFWVFNRALYVLQHYFDAGVFKQRLWYSGENLSGQDGSGNSTGNILTSTIVSNLDLPPGVFISDMAMAYRGGASIYLLLSDSTVMWWGRSMIDDPPTSTIHTPTLLDGVVGITQIFGSDGSGTVYFLDGAGTVWGLGSDSSGALANGFLDSGGNYVSSDHFALPPIQIFIAGKSVTQLMKGSSATYAMFVLTNDQQVWGWGKPDYLWGELSPSVDAHVPPLQVFPDLFDGILAYPAIDLVLMSSSALFVRTGTANVIPPPPTLVSPCATVLV